jgi:hypothetical protein
LLELGATARFATPFQELGVRPEVARICSPPVALIGEPRRGGLTPD